MYIHKNKKKVKHIQLHSLLQGNYAKISAYFYLNFCNGKMLEKLKPNAKFIDVKLKLA